MEALLQTPCSIDDIEAMINQTEFWTVNEETGEPEIYQDITTEGDLEGYVCRGCDEEFTDFEGVKKHLKEAK